MTTVTEFAARSARAYERNLLEQLREHGLPEATNPEDVGRRAALFTTSGQAWSDDVGPFYDADGARQALGGVTRQAVSQRTRAGRLLGLQLAANGAARVRIVYPTWQFREPVLRALPDVLAAAGYDPDRPTTGWTIAAWLTTPDPDHGDVTPLELLSAGHRHPVLATARAVAEQLGAAERRAVG